MDVLGNYYNINKRELIVIQTMKLTNWVKYYNIKPISSRKQHWLTCRIVAQTMFTRNSPRWWPESSLRKHLNYYYIEVYPERRFNIKTVNGKRQKVNFIIPLTNKAILSRDGAEPTLNKPRLIIKHNFVWPCLRPK